MSELEWMDIFADNLVDILKYANMTQRELADVSGLAESTISQYISKKRLPSIPSIINISYALDIDINELIDFGERII